MGRDNEPWKHNKKENYLKDAKKDFIHFVRSLSNTSDIHYSEKIAASEKQVGFKNVALCNLIKSFGNIENDPNDVLDFYFIKPCT